MNRPAPSVRDVSQTHHRQLLLLAQRIEGEATRLLLGDSDEETDSLYHDLADFHDRLRDHVTWARQAFGEPAGGAPESRRLFLRCQSDLLERVSSALSRIGDDTVPRRLRINEVLQMMERVRLDLGEVELRSSQLPPSVAPRAVARL